MKRAYWFMGTAVLLAVVGLAGCSGKGGAAGQEAAVPAADAPAMEAASGESAAQAVQAAADVPSGGGYRLGGTGPSGGFIYYIDGADLYEALPPGKVVGAAETLPTGWIMPDLEDLGLINDAVQKSGAADYKNFWYISANKAGGKNQYYRMSDGQKTTDAVNGRKIGVRISKAPAGAAIAASTPAAIPDAEKPSKRPGDDPPPAANQAASQSAASQPIPAGAKYQIGDTGPNGGIVFAYSGGKFLEITRPENAAPFYRDIARVKELIAEERRFHDAGAEREKLYEKQRAYDELIRQRKEAGRDKFDWETDASSDYFAVLAKIDELVNEENRYISTMYARNAEFNKLTVTEPPAGWRKATIAELITAHAALAKSGKVRFGNVLYMAYSPYYADAGRNSGLAGTPPDLPDGTDFDTMRLYFPQARIIQVRGGGSDPPYELLDMADGKTIYLDIGMMNMVSQLQAHKNYTIAEVRIPYVREF